MSNELFDAILMDLARLAAVAWQMSFSQYLRSREGVFIRGKEASGALWLSLLSMVALNMLLRWAEPSTTAADWLVRDCILLGIATGFGTHRGKKIAEFLRYKQLKENELQKLSKLVVDNK